MTHAIQTIESKAQVLVKEFSGAKVSADFYALDEISRDVNDGLFQFELEGRHFEIAKNEELTIVSVVLQVDVLARGTELRVIAALGGAKEKFGLVDAGACFVTLKYNEIGELVSVDFSSSIYR